MLVVAFAAKRYAHLVRLSDRGETSTLHREGGDKMAKRRSRRARAGQVSGTRVIWIIHAGDLAMRNWTLAILPLMLAKARGCSGDERARDGGTRRERRRTRQ